MSTEGLQLRSLVKKSGELELSLVPVTLPDPAGDEVVVRIEAAPINPVLSDATIVWSKPRPFRTR